MGIYDTEWLENEVKRRVNDFKVCRKLRVMYLSVGVVVSFIFGFIEKLKNLL